MDDSNQIEVPPSFLALYSTPSGTRLIQPMAFVRERYELCEDLAQMLVDQASTAQFKSGAPEVEVLRAMREGLRAEGSAVEPPEANWVVLRLAELLQWEGPEGD
ncbi:ATPase with chaperone activity [Ramlibacter humi]|uniref:ATPase with chaperone activity n=1 Tax=Ramlibacter humi TaxID=2530451 RepID=A0A4Z0BB48_9BURK|nr:ATPase with chaperone activity [Ramlibacter humi]TFY96322.1 ATPase with chaperone activity [Ramlibacter humi]